MLRRLVVASRNDMVEAMLGLFCSCLEGVEVKVREERLGLRMCWVEGSADLAREEADVFCMRGRVLLSSLDHSGAAIAVYVRWMSSEWSG